MVPIFVKKRGLVILFILYFVHPAQSESIELTSGRVLEGRILEQTNEFIKLQAYDDFVITIYHDEIVKIIKTSSLEERNPLNVSPPTASQDNTESKPKAQLLSISPIKQYPQLCGEAVAEMIFLYFGIDRVGYDDEYVISGQSRGSAVGQYYCDLKAQGSIKNDQPACVDRHGSPILVYHKGQPTSKESTKQAFKDGTRLDSLKIIFGKYGIRSKYVKSVYDHSNRLDPQRVYINFDGLLEQLHKGNPVIFHVSNPSGKKGHYLLAYGYDDERNIIYYIDPNPSSGHSSKSFVFYDDFMGGVSFYKKERFWTGRYLAIGNF